ncbi:TolC family protein [Paraferrimonas sedimenticola]|uniref:Transporter n=1 Tax=Paraferrimonas sedimenticola TaxID=375674 RepID=A0AA37RX64_9GAMM|nr:TolC family protein [Paraferrimonas sedimenticola]GLP96975.1 transporter [Paraferrimonas sedimenticola]
MALISAFFLVPAAIFFASAVQAEPLSFADSWQKLLEVSPKLRAEQQQVNRAEAERQATDSLNYPSLDVGGSYTRLQKPIRLDLRDLNPIALLPEGDLPAPLPGLDDSFFVTPLTEQNIFRASLDALWPIYTGGRVTAAQGIKAAQVQEKQQQAELASRDLFTLLVDRYYAVSVTEQMTATHRSLVQSLTVHVDNAKKLEEQGQIAKVERLNAEVALGNAKVALRSAERQQEMAQIALSRMLDLKAAEPSSCLFVLQNLPELGRLSELTLKDHPALKLLKAKETQAQALIDLEKGGHYPSVFLFGSYTLYKDKSLFSRIEPDWLVGVGVKVPIVSREGHSGKERAAASALLQAKHTKAQTRQDLSLLVDQSYRQLLQAQEEIVALNGSIELAQENLRLREVAFRQGLSTSIERVDAELKLNGATLQQLGAKYRYIQSYAKLMAVSGQIDEFIGRSQSAPQY